MLVGEEGVMMEFPDGEERLVRLHLTGFTGDQPAVCKPAGLVGPNDKSPCRDCGIHGYYSNHYHFPSKLKISSARISNLYNPRSLPHRTVSETDAAIESIQNSSGSALRNLQRDTGIRENSVLFQIRSMVPYTSFPHDVMHTFYNIQNEMLRIILGSYQDDFSIGKSQLVLIDEELSAWKSGISGQLGPKPKPLSKYKEWKAADHKEFSASYSVVIFYGYLPTEYLHGLGLLSEIVDICTRRTIDRLDSQRLRRVCVLFFDHFEKFYVKYRKDRVDFCKSVFHVLLHLADCTKRYGPLIGVSQYWLEGYIGWVSQRNNSRTKPAQSMMKNAVYGEGLKVFYGKGTYEKENTMMEVISEGGYILLNPFKSVKLSGLPDSGRSQRELLADYLCRKYQNLSVEDGKSIASQVNWCRYASRVCFSAGYETQTAAVYKNLGGRAVRKTTARASFYVAVEMEGTQGTTEVWYGRVLRLMTVDLSHFVAHDISAARHDIAVIDWAKKLTKGGQCQIYSVGRAKEAFSEATAEDISVIKRLIKAVEHGAHREYRQQGNTRRASTTRTYFLDDCVRSDHLFSNSRVSINGVKKRLMGFSRR